MYNVPLYSPWGQVDYCEKICDGVYSVSTSSHGGIMVNQVAAYSLFSTIALKHAFKDDIYYCFEEDCAAAIAIRELMDKSLFSPPVNEFYSPGEYEQLIDKSIQRWYPDYWADRENRIFSEDTRCSQNVSIPEAKN